MLLRWDCPPDQRSTEKIVRLPAVVSALNNEVTQLIGKKSVKAIKEKAVNSKPSTKYFRPVRLDKNKAPSWNKCSLFI